VVFLYPRNVTEPVEMPGEANGLLAVGNFTAENLIGSSANMTMNDLLMEMD
jgi:hypothetical protein